jgi:hypothetical protein
MNLDFKVPMSGKLARRLHQIKSLLPLEFDERILNHINDDMLDFDQVQASIAHTNLPKGLTPKRQAICQYVADCDYRAVIGALTCEDAVEMVMTSALSSGKRIAILYDQTSIDWETSLAELDIQYVTEVPNNEASTANVVLVKSSATFDAIKQHGRDRVIVHIPNHFNGLFHASGDEPQIVKTRKRVTLFRVVQDIGLDFPHLVLGFYPGRTQDDESRIKFWCADTRIIDLINAVNNDKKVSKALSLEMNGQRALKNIGFTRTLPGQIAKMLNVNVDLLTSENVFGEDA